MAKKYWADVQDFMAEHVGEFVDPRTGEVNMTTLAEYACDVFDGYAKGCEIPEEYFELAFIVAEGYGPQSEQDEVREKADELLAHFETLIAEAIARGDKKIGPAILADQFAEQWEELLKEASLTQEQLSRSFQIMQCM